MKGSVFDDSYLVLRPRAGPRWPQSGVANNIGTVLRAEVRYAR